MAGSPRIGTRAGLVPGLQPITPAEGEVLTVQQLASIVDAINGIIRAVNGRLTFGDGTHSSQSGNIDGHTKTMVFGRADTDYEVPHGLGRKPIGIIVLAVDNPAPVTVQDTIGNPYTLGTEVRGSNEGSWGPTRLFVRCNMAGVTARFVVI